ncbi:T9SS type A sorting domain-containing protein, partial [candidate division WOR-3 bacterium]|nr:T9SS type A sorting domain-containing protein [candidate division WOR-3 bacterium]
NYSETIGIQYYYDGTYHELAAPVTNSFALKYTTYPPEYVGIEEEPVSVLNLPKVYGLSNSYPNPCCNMAVINYQIPRKGEVSLRVYDISGRLTDVLIDGVLEPGYHSLRLDTKGYASGVYFYRLIAEGKTFTRKMIVVK